MKTANFYKQKGKKSDFIQYSTKHYQQKKRNHERKDFTARTAVYLAANIKIYLMN